jgi:2-phosphoglycerate kinase
VSRPPIFFITGPPAAGKSTLAEELASRFELGIAIPMDDVREWVTQGIAHPLNWNEETSRQFDLALDAAVDIAIRYNDAGFAVVIEHCHQPPRIAEVFKERLNQRKTILIALAPDLQANHFRNESRTTKSFDASELKPSIEALNPLYRSDHVDLASFVRIDNTDLNVVETAEIVLKQPYFDEIPASGASS